MQDDVSRHKHWVIVGLGNPGLSYSQTRHNLGYKVVNEWGKELSWPFKKDPRTSTETARGNVKGASIHLVLPTTYMNESGRAVQRYLSYYRLAVEDLIVVIDDVALPFGAVRLRTEGSSGGHNGLKSIEEHIGSQRFARLRMGVGQPREGQDLADYVLERFTQEESSQLDQVIQKGVKALVYLTEHTVEHAMNLVNTKDW
jgi:PTH1 family peptidyl-tRNA hydrolase